MDTGEAGAEVSAERADLGESEAGLVDDAVAGDMGVCGLNTSELGVSEGSAGGGSREEGKVGGIGAGQFGGDC